MRERARVYVCRCACICTCIRDTPSPLVDVGAYIPTCTRVTCVCVCASVCTTSLSCAPHAAARKRSNLRGVHDSVAPGILSRSRGPACGPPPNHRGPSPPSSSSPPSFVLAPSPVIPPPGARRTPLRSPRALRFTPSLASSRGPLSFSLPPSLPPAVALSPLASHCRFTHSPASLPLALFFIGPSVSLIPSYVHLALARKSIAGRTCVCIGGRDLARTRARSRTCVRVAYISRALCSLLPFYEALHDVHLCPSRTPPVLRPNTSARVHIRLTIGFITSESSVTPRLCILTSRECDRGENARLGVFRDRRARYEFRGTAREELRSGEREGRGIPCRTAACIAADRSDMNFVDAPSDKIERSSRINEHGNTFRLYRPYIIFSVG